MEIVRKPKIDTRSEELYVGIRTLAPFKGMFKVVDQIRAELNAWIQAQDITPAGMPFMRLHVVDMRGTMDLAYGIPVNQVPRAQGQIITDVLPAGRYASLVYTGGGGVSANRALIEWVRGKGLEFDRWDTAQGDNFRSRYERYLTDPEIEPRKKRRNVEVAIKLRD